MKPIESWHIVIAGFLQDEGETNGMVTLWRNLHSRYAGPDTCVEFRAWSDCAHTLAEKIWLCSPRVNGRTPEGPSVKLYGYSWGGYSASLVAYELAKRGIGVEAMVLSDAVYRHYYALGQWRALVPWSRIQIPGNVGEVHWFRQRNNLPAGHKLIADDPNRTLVHEPVELDCIHQYADDASAFHAKALEVAEW